MATFSQRIGLTAATNPIQIESMSIPLRNSIWNLALVIVDETEITLPGWCVIAAKGFFKLPIDEVPQHAYYSSLKWLKENFAALSWAQVYEYSEFLAEKIPPLVFERNRYTTDNLRTHSLHNRFNGIFESECSGYRFVGGILVPISNPAEVGEISTALQTTSRPELNGAHVHISSAMDLLAKKT